MLMVVVIYRIPLEIASKLCSFYSFSLLLLKMRKKKRCDIGVFHGCGQ